MLLSGKRASFSNFSSLSRGLHFDTLEPRLLLSADLIPVSGTIEVPGETDYYKFELAEERQVLFDALTNDSQMTWALEGQGGQVVSPTPFTSSDGAQGGGILSLQAGTYTLRVDGTGDRTGDYQFRLLNLTNSNPVDPGTQITGTLEEGGRETDLFQFEAEAGTTLFFDSQAFSSGTAYWQLVDPEGTTVFGPSAMNGDRDQTRINVSKTGVYTLLLEGYIHNNADSNYAFTVEQVVDETQTMELDAVIAGQLTQAGQRNIYTFSVAEDTRAYFDTLKTPNDDIRVTLSGPAGTIMSNVELRYADGWNANPALFLAAGGYTLTIGGTNDNKGNYAFQILTDVSAQLISTGEQVSDTLTDRGTFAADLRDTSNAPIDGDPGGLVRFRQGGSGVYADNVSELNSAAFTLEAWVKPTEDRLYDVLAMRTTSTSWNDGFGLYLDGAGNVVFFINQWSDDSQRVSAELVQDTWSHIAATYEEGSLKLYIDGAPVAENVITQTINHANVPLWFGKSNGGYHLRGEMDEARYWTVARSGAEIAASYDQILQGDEAGLLANYGFDETAGTDMANRVAGGPAGHFETGPGTETRLLKLSASKGDRLVVDAYNSGNIYTRIFDQYGNQVLSARGLGDLDPLVIPGDGDYTILIEGYALETVSRSFSYLVLPESRQELSLTVGEVIDSDIAVIGESDAYSFTLAGPARLYFDQLTSRSDITWSLYGPRGTEISGRRFDQTDSYTTSSNLLLNLDAGDYTLVVDGSGVATGRYAFRMFDVANATEIAYDADAVNDVTLSPGNETEAFRFTAAHGDQFSLPRITNNVWVRILDPIGRQIFNSHLSNLSTTTAQLGGEYLVLFEGYPSGTPSSDQLIQFKLVKDGETTIEDYEGTAYVLGETVNGTISQASEIDDYIFTVTEETFVYFDALSYGGTGTVYWTLNGPAGTLANQWNFASSDSIDYSGSPRFSLVPGTYQLRIFRASTQTGDYAFRMLDLSQATAIDLDTEFSGTLLPRAETEIYSFELT